jgi:hypothetical protein
MGGIFSLNEQFNCITNESFQLCLTPHFIFWHSNWRTPNSLKDSNVSPSERQQKKESGRAP